MDALVNIKDKRYDNYEHNCVSWRMRVLKSVHETSQAKINYLINILTFLLTHDIFY
jgi:hypothetical protein